MGTRTDAERDAGATTEAVNELTRGERMKGWLEDVLLLRGPSMKTMLLETLEASGRHDVSSYSAALAFHAVFSLAPLAVLVVAVFSFFLGQSEAEQLVLEQVERLLGPEVAAFAAPQIQALATSHSSAIATVIAIGVVVWGASRILYQLRRALNAMWEVEYKPGAAGLLSLLVSRAIAIGLVLAAGGIMIVSLLATTILQALASALPEETIANMLLDQTLQTTFEALDRYYGLASTAVLALVFMVLFKVLPDRDVSWRDVVLGALLTALGFKIGEALIATYIRVFGVGSAYGVAGSVIAFLVWVLYMSKIVLYGAEFTHTFARNRGSLRAEEEARSRAAAAEPAASSD